MRSVEWFVDTGYWIAVVNRRDDLHQRALLLAADLRRPLVTTEAVLLEVGNALARAPLRVLAGPLLTGIRTNPNIATVPVSPSLFARALELYISRADKEWGLIDCVSFVVMEDRGIQEALSADQHFVQAGFRALLRE